MPTLGNTPRPAYVYDTETDTWVPVGVGAHTHSDIPNTLVDAKGDLITATADNVPARLAKGTDGTVLVADSTTSTGLSWQPYGAIQAAGKNKFINGDCNINQRSFSSQTLTTESSVYIVDRIFGLNVVSGSSTFSVQQFTPGSAPVAGYEAKQFIRAVSTGQSNIFSGTFFGQTIEDVRNFAGQTATVSFWAKAATGTPNVSFEFRQVFGTGGSPSATVENAGGGQKFAISTSWVRYSMTITLPSISGKTLGTNNNSMLECNIWVSAGSAFNSRTNSLGIQSNTFDIWGLQIESGPIATPFTTATGTIQGELAACQRYYYRTTAGDTFATMGIMGVGQSSTTAEFFLQLPVTMRTKPTSVDFSAIRIADGTNIAAITGATMNTAQSTVNIAHLNFSASSGIVQYRIYNVSANANAAAFLGVSAEL
jgi:hypothetical protein